MVAYNLARKNRWVQKPSPSDKGAGNGWVNELNTAFRDKTKNYAVMTRKIDTDWGTIEHICIRNKENSDISWAEKQRIKNELLGEEALAIEVFPRTRDLIDEANMYHLWVLPDDFELPFGLHK